MDSYFLLFVTVVINSLKKYKKNYLIYGPHSLCINNLFSFIIICIADLNSRMQIIKSFLTSLYLKICTSILDIFITHILFDNLIWKIRSEKVYWLCTVFFSLSLSWGVGSPSSSFL